MMIEARCNRCGRSTIDPDDMSAPDDIPQPDGRPCGGTFIVPPGPHDLDVHPRREPAEVSEPDEFSTILAGVCPLCAIPFAADYPIGVCDHEADYYREWLARLTAKPKWDDYVMVVSPEEYRRQEAAFAAKQAQKSAVEAPTIPSKRRKPTPLGEDSGQT